jgi:hypothetical protein
VAAIAAVVLGAHSPIHGQSVLPELTVAGDALFQGQAHFGSLLNGAGGPGFRVSVSQTPITVENQVWVEDSYKPVTRYEDVWDTIVDGYTEEIWGWVTHEVWHPAEGFYMDVGTGSYDDDGNELMTQEWVETAPSFMTSEQEYEVTSSNWVQTGSTYGIVDTVPITEEVFVPGYWESHPVNDFSAPIVDFTANRSGTSWRWQNPSDLAGNQTLMTLTSGGLSFPSMANDEWSRRSFINDLESRFSRIINGGVNSSRQALGSKQTHAGIEVWGEEGGSVSTNKPDRIASPQLSNTAKLEHNALTLARSLKQSGTTVSRSTRILADYAEFGGMVEVKGTLRVAPSGDLSMGIYTATPNSN